MNRTYFKAIATDGTDFHTGKVHWLPDDGAPIPAGGWVVEHPTSERVGDDARTYLSVSILPTDCAGMGWPCRLLRVVPDGRQVSIPEPVGLPSKRASIRWRVTEELPAWQALGPQGHEIETLLGQVESLTEDQTLAMSAAWCDAWSAARGAARDAVWGAAWDAVWDAAWDAVRDAVRDAAWDAVRGAALDAVRGLLVLDLEPDAAEILLTPWVSVMGRSWEVAA
ncbi:hypothetical protein BMR99_03375 [Propionibacterium freudenreichii]|uniref:Uncharacterized protein n=1 Tax=Propionibacterium freudenreichii TaxID=1744 RepID=A0A509MKJ9_9ACTN|nr:hypothetical protein [Propionibacterium freudenreichii]ARO11691.1 hypothetical protein BMR99_03375 [Propionibacterium freudenreichii]SCQ79674.1 Hypothetical protein PFR_JS23_1453 [Propionibacterium freudenreichii]SCQ83277.1 Hypothetical protein PFR_JS23-PH_59 [Propionibacterium freudenreichii]SUY93617.1 Hypothetical protein PFR_JS23-PH_59 [Propionibacterium freudenreichii]